MSSKRHFNLVLCIYSRIMLSCEMLCSLTCSTFPLSFSCSVYLCLVSVEEGLMQTGFALDPPPVQLCNTFSPILNCRWKGTKLTCSSPSSASHRCSLTLFVLLKCSFSYFQSWSFCYSNLIKDQKTKISNRCGSDSLSVPIQWAHPISKASLFQLTLRSWIWWNNNLVHRRTEFILPEEN